MPAQQLDASSPGHRWRLYLDIWNLVVILLGAALALLLGPILD